MTSFPVRLLLFLDGGNMNKTTKKLKRLEKYLAKRLDKEFGGLKNWYFMGDMHSGMLIITIHAKEKK